MTYPEVRRKLWEYIKTHKLQDPQDGRIVRADDKLRPLLDGADSIGMMQIAALLAKNLE